MVTFNSASPKYSLKHYLIRKTYPSKAYPLIESHFYIEKLGFAGVHIPIFLIFAPKHRLWVLVRTASSGIPIHTPVCYVKVGYEGVYISWTCFPDGRMFSKHSKLKCSKVKCNGNSGSRNQSSLLSTLCCF